MTAIGYTTFIGYLAKKFLRQKVKKDGCGYSNDEAGQFASDMNKFLWTKPVIKILAHAKLQAIKNPIPSSHYSDWREFKSFAALAKEAYSVKDIESACACFYFLGRMAESLERPDTNQHRENQDRAVREHLTRKNRSAANIRHQENYVIKESLRAWHEKNRGRFLDKKGRFNQTKAAKEAIKFEPISERKAAEYMGEFEKAFKV